MKINHNISAMISNDHLLFNEGRLSQSTERLSSGLKINHAKDNPSGTAISIKMRAQIHGLDQASENSRNGTSVVETADGAMGELTQIVQRLRELSVQAASDTNTPTDRASLQQEIESLTEEVDRISNDTEYNNINLFDGSLDIRSYATITGDSVSNPNSVTVIDTSNASPGNYIFEVSKAATRAGFLSQGSYTPTTSGTFTINGVQMSVTAGESASDLWDSLCDVCEKANVEIAFVDGNSSKDFTYGETIEFLHKEYGDAVSITISCSDSSIASALGFQDVCIEANNYSAVSTGTDAEINIDSGANSSFTGRESYVIDGQRITIHGVDGFELITEASEKGTVTVEVTDMGPLYLQIGANEKQAIEVELPNLSAHNLGIDKVNVQSAAGASRAIGIYDIALEKLNSVRASLGAYENRLEHTYNNLETTEESLTSAYSRIVDVDMADEMTTFTNMQILVQAGTSVLAQANELPDQALQMLR